jgi:hypothetical protein
MFLWWLWRLALLFCSCFFVLFGVAVLTGSYSMTDPFLFMMTFIASSMMILISAAILFGLIVRTVKDVRSKGEEKTGDEK